jgi:hypothetical protein
MLTATMAAPTSSFPVRGQDQLNLMFEGVIGQGRVYPRIVFSFQARYGPLPRDPQAREVDVRRLVMEVSTISRWPQNSATASFSSAATVGWSPGGPRRAGRRGKAGFR